MELFDFRVIFAWWLWGVRVWWWKLNHAAISRAYIVERQGTYYDLFLAVRTTQDKKGETFKYADSTLLVPKNHPYESWEDERLLGVVDGELVATPFKGTGVPLEADVISAICQGNVARQYADEYTIANRGFGGWRLVLIIVGIAVVGFVIWKYVLHGHIPGAGVTPVITPTPTPTPTQGPIFSLYSWLMWGLNNAL